MLSSLNRAIVTEVAASCRRRLDAAMLVDVHHHAARTLKLLYMVPFDFVF